MLKMITSLGKFTKKIFISMGLVSAITIIVLPSYYFYDKYQKSQQLLKNPTEAARQEVKTLVGRVGDHIELPDEEPTIATVSDKEKLADQSFFLKAENGDKVLIYTKARKAILFRPATNKIIEVSTVNLGQASPETLTGTPSPQVKKTKLVIYNGTNTVGLSSTAEKQLKENIKNLEVVAKENANKKDYEKTIVVALLKDTELEAQAVTELLRGSLSTLPDGEIKPEADILIILGNDYNKR